MSASSTLPSGAILGLGLASALNHQIQYIARSSNNSFGPNGNSWFVITVPYISYGTVMVDDMSREIFMVQSQSSTTRWLWDSGTSQYVGEYGTRRLVAITADGYLVTQPSGASWLFFGPDALAGLQGKLKQMTAADGTVTIANYDGSQQLTSLVRSLPGTQHDASLIYTSATSGPSAGRYVTVEKRISRDGVTQPVKRWLYTYHTGTDSAGNLNDLKTASEAIYNAQTSEWETLYTTYYRYYTEDSAEGFKYGLRFTLNPQDYARMVAAGYPPEDPTISPDSLLATFATSFRQYDTQRRVTVWQARGGTLTTTYERLDSDGTGQNWSRRSIKTTADGSVQTVYYNEVNQPVLKILTGTGVRTVEYSEYDDQYHLVLRCGSDAIASFTEPSTSSENFSVTLNTDQGLINCWTYYPMTGGGSGAAPGYVQWQGVQQGTSGTVVKIYELTYNAYTVGGDTLYRIASRTEYRSDTSGGSNPATTTYDYEWRTDSQRPLQQTVTLPVVSTDENGTGETYTQVVRYDFFGNPQWLKDEIGVLVFQVFDPLTGGLWQRITDVDTQRMNPGVVPPDWITPTDGGYHLISDYECDTQGRNLQELGPLHSCDLDGIATQVRSAIFRVYLDGRRQVWVSQGYAIGDGYRTLGPVNITQRDLRGQITDQIDSSNFGGNKIDGDDRFPQSNWTKWSRRVYSDESLILAVCDYHTIPTSDREVDQNPVLGFKIENYLESGYGYDVQDRPNKKVSPGGTITRMVLDARGLVTESWVGTNDIGATDTNPAGSGPSSGNNMVKVLTNTYNNGQVDNPGILIEQRRPFNDTSADDQNVTYDYDFRGRLILTTTNDGSQNLLKATVYDNQSRPISNTSYYYAVGDEYRSSYQTISLDAMGRPYLRQNYGVILGTGVLTYPLQTKIWYDPRGLPIKTVQPGFNGYTKIQSDTLGRLTANYVAYPVTGGLDGNSNNVTDDIVIEQSENSYDEANNLLLHTSRQRFLGTTGTGPLQGPSGLEPLACVTYVAQWADPIGRLRTQANYGTNGGAELTRPILAPSPSDTILVSRTDYAQDGQPAQTVDPDGVVTQTQKDRLGRTILLIENFVADAPETDNGANRTTEYVYSPDGDLSRLNVKNIVTGDQITRWDYGTTLANSGVARTDLLKAKMYPCDIAPDGTVLQSLSYTYNRQSVPTGTIDANGNEHTFDLDKLGRIVEDRVVVLGPSVDGSVRRIGRTYDARGLVNSITSYSDPTVGSGAILNQVVSQYNAFGQLISDIQSHNGVVDDSTPRVSYTYADGSAGTTRRTSITYPSGAVINITYGDPASIDDRLDRMAQTQISGESNALANFQWAGTSRFLRLGMPQPQLELTYIKPANEPVGDSGDPYSGYDRFGRTVDMRWNKIAGDAATMLDRIQYGYDRASRRLWRQDLAAPSSTRQDKFYAYDGLGQVTSANQGNLNINHTAIAAVPASAESFAYDPIGNWLNYQGDEAGFPTLKQERKNNQDNQIVSLNSVAAGVGYDANGNMIATLPLKSGNWSTGYTVAWDAWNRLAFVRNDGSSMEIAKYGYDGSNRRIISQTTGQSCNFYYNDVWKCVEERKTVSDHTDTTTYFWGMRPGHRDELLRRDNSGTSIYCLMDYYDPIAISDSSGVVQERYNYSAFGLTQFQAENFTPASESAFDWNFLFHGQFQDAETGWNNYGYRYYSPDLGLWLSRDPIQEKGGLNLYSMAGNNAINQVDAFGLAPNCCNAYPEDEIVLDHLGRTCCHSETGQNPITLLFECGGTGAKPPPPKKGERGGGGAIVYKDFNDEWSLGACLTSVALNTATDIAISMLIPPGLSQIVSIAKDASGVKFDLNQPYGLTQDDPNAAGLIKTVGEAATEGAYDRLGGDRRFNSPGVKPKKLARLVTAKRFVKTVWGLGAVLSAFDAIKDALACASENASRQSR
jgi:RHS repeat-associated protein